MAIAKKKVAAASCKECENKQKEIDNLTTKLKSANGKVGSLTQSVEKLTNEKAALTVAIGELQLQKDLLDKSVKDWKKSYDCLTKDYNMCKSELKAVADMVEDNKERVEAFLNLKMFRRVLLAMKPKKLAAALKD